ncbi:Chagasin family peptidase inhibitor I42 [Polaribacter sp. KT25b]|uniref:protease inhibitor I42 family protein n=1 Tax=Polaribacter sp. KT25b TaxID=1855336 RepID=UPI00087D9230|nr:protease inhibitor I42 family protein [Polaribacter sp. KT25b]SDR98739.1 Chagasin family peptidase inhibitor I42 [Polaribacter sp. KT25b]
MKKIFLIVCLISISLQSCKLIENYKATEGYKVNEEFKIELEKEGDGGYQWSYIPIPEVEQINTSKKIIKSEGKLLVSYNKVFTFKALKPGTYNLEFHFLRSFEKLDSIPEDFKKIIKVNIKK